MSTTCLAPQEVSHVRAGTIFVLFIAVSPENWMRPSVARIQICLEWIPEIIFWVLILSLIFLILAHIILNFIIFICIFKSWSITFSSTSWKNRDHHRCFPSAFHPRTNKLIRFTHPYLFLPLQRMRLLSQSWLHSDFSEPLPPPQKHILNQLSFLSSLLQPLYQHFPTVYKNAQDSHLQKLSLGVTYSCFHWFSPKILKSLAYAAYCLNFSLEVTFHLHCFTENTLTKLTDDCLSAQCDGHLQSLFY